MRKLLSLCALVAAFAVPVAAHADPMMVGQFSIGGTVVNTPSTNTLAFTVGSNHVGDSTQTGTFASILSSGELVTANSTMLVYSPYVCCFQIYAGAFTATINSITATTSGVFTVFTGTATFSYPGYADTPGTFNFSTQNTGAVTYSATGIAAPEPSSLMLLGTGVLGAAGMLRRRFMANA